MRKRVLVKVGSNVLTRPDGKIDVTRMSSIVDQIVWLLRQGCEVIMVSSGAVVCGKGELNAGHELDNVEQRQLFAALGQVKLMQLYYDLFREFGVKVGQVLTMKKNFSTEEEYLNQKACVGVMLQNNVVPIVNENDTVSITELMFTDNDELSGLVAAMTDCDELVILTNVDGVYDGDPQDGASKVIRRVEVGSQCRVKVSAAKSSNGRGGMASKLRVAQKVASQGIKVLIANGTRDNILVDLETQPEATVHTEFLPAARKENAKSIGVLPLISSETEALFQQVKQASTVLSSLTDQQRAALLRAVADEIDQRQEEILRANRLDLSRMKEENPLYDRLMLTPQRLKDIAADMRHVADLPSPLGNVTKERVLENGLHLRRVSVPFGVIGVIYEARPNVTFDVFSLCFKAGSACVLKGGRDAQNTNVAAVELIHNVLQRMGVNPCVVELLPATHEATEELLNAVGYVDLCIPRGGRRLIDTVRNNARVPVIETGAGVVHCYFDEKGDLDIGVNIIDNAKTRRPSVCNALDTLLICEKRLADLSLLLRRVGEKGVEIFADEQAYNALAGSYPDSLLRRAEGEKTWRTEWMSLRMGVRTVADIREALRHIAQFGSGHSESLVSEDEETQRMFRQKVDAACVYVNAPTSFTDGGQFGMGAEIGISTQKLGARGPMALEEITTYKWLIDGRGQVR